MSHVANHITYLVRGTRFSELTRELYTDLSTYTIITFSAEQISQYRKMNFLSRAVTPQIVFAVVHLRRVTSSAE